jgi:microsomal epoxide hydrolase
MSVHPFSIHVDQANLDDLHDRLSRTRWAAAHERVDDWTYGASSAYLHALIDHWQDRFDWYAQERKLNQLHHFKADIDGVHIHFIHERGRGPRPLPLLLTHGFPDSFVRFLRIVPMLTDPAAHGGDPADAFDVVVPSLPGFGFSDKPAHPGYTFRIGDLFHRLMTDELGYTTFAAHGGDWGSTITEQIARSHVRSILGIHLTDVPFWHVLQTPEKLSRIERRFIDRTSQWQHTEGAYAFVQANRPDTLAQSLMDSPAGLAAWIVDKFHAWSDCGDDIDHCFTKDELLTNVMVYWVSGTIGTSFRPYYDFANRGPLAGMFEGFERWIDTSPVPAAFAIFPKDVAQPPRKWAERFFNVQRWTQMPRGGHFAAMEQPDLLAEDLRAFFRSFRASVPEGSVSHGVVTARNRPPPIHE